MNDRSDEIRSTRAPALRGDQIEILRRYGETSRTEAGQVLFRAGDISNDFIVVLEGEVEVIDDFAGEARAIGVFRAGRFPGELNMLTGQAMYLTAVVRQGGEVLEIPREKLKEVVTEEPNLSDIILKAFLARRAYLMRTGVGLRIIGSRNSRDATRLREFAARNRVPHVWIEIEEDPTAEALLERFGAKPSETPVTIWQGKDVLKNPTNAELARTIGLKVDAPQERTYDLVVVGAGPAGLGAAVYGASEGLSTLALECSSDARKQRDVLAPVVPRSATYEARLPLRDQAYSAESETLAPISSTKTNLSASTSSSTRVLQAVLWTGTHRALPHPAFFVSAPSQAP